MTLRPRLVIAALVGLLASACSSCRHSEPSAKAGPDVPPPPSAAQPLEFTLIFSASLVGHLEPCGCSPDQRGGVGRAAGAIDEIRAEGRPVLVVDGGDRFFPAASEATDPLVAGQHRLQARTMAEATRAMGYDALVLGGRDSGAGASFFQSEALPPVLDTGDSALPGTRPFLVKEVAGRKVGLLAIGAGEGAPATLAARAAGAREQGATILIAVVYRPFEAAKALLPAAKAAGIDFVLASRADVPALQESAALTDADPPLFAVHARGEALLRLDIVAEGPVEEPFVKFAGAGERDEELHVMQQRLDRLREDVTTLSPADPLRKLKTDKLLELESRKAKIAAAPPPALPRGVNAYTFASIPMTPSLTELPAVRWAIDDYTVQVAKRNFEYAKAHPRACPKAPKGKAAFVGDEKCSECHEEAYEFWKTTPHAHAYRTLVDKNRQYDVNCVSCHVLAFEKAGGACSIAQTEGRQNVQCESCHGPGSLHARDGEKKFIAPHTPEAACKVCHDPENSPHFNFATYRPQIIGPGHGAAAPK